MQAKILATAFTVACLLSACGFVPPAPPMPDDSNRVAINHGDPRKTQDADKFASAPAPAEPVKIALDQTAQASPSATSPVPAASTPVSGKPQPPAIPVPPAPPKPHTPAAAPATSDKALATAPTDAVQPMAETNAPIVASSALVPTTDALASLPTSADSTPVPPSAPEPAPQPIVVKEVWHLSPDDGTVRQALTRWAAKAGWTFGPDQWELNFDLPIQAPAEFEAESFQEAIQALSQAIAMTESPVRPCFYANRVLRVIPFTRSCNRAPAATLQP